jgi:tetraacyldisaccharide 4'-kinase
MASIALWPLARLWEGAARGRAALYAGGFLARYQLKKPVVSVGNLSTGGTGKTPFVLWLWHELAARGVRASVLTRGYRREDIREPLLFTGSEGSERAGDEVRLLLQAGVRPVGVAGRREIAGMAIEAGEAGEPVDIHLLDDGFQHLSLVRALDIVLLDCTRPPWEYDLLPAGRLREPLAALGRANIIVLTRAYGWTNVAELERQVREHCPRALVTRAISEVSGVSREIGPAFAFAGIGNPKAFFDDLGRAGVEVIDSLSFWDHHRYTAADRDRIASRAKQCAAVSIVTTEKDAMNLGGEIPNLVVAGARLVIDHGDEIIENVLQVEAL